MCICLFVDNVPAIILFIPISNTNAFLSRFRFSKSDLSPYFFTRNDGSFKIDFSVHNAISLIMRYLHQLNIHLSNS